MGRFLWARQWVELSTYKSVSQESYHCNSYHCFVFFVLFQHKIIELKTKEYKELAEHVKTEMEKLV